MWQNLNVIKLRSIIRKTGLTKLIGKVLAKKDYEMLFEKALLTNLKDTDIVFDIGANRGFYTQKFALKATEGTVYAFEPIPYCYNIVNSLKKQFTNIEVYQMAIGSKKDKVPMSIGKDDLNATSAIKDVKEENDVMVEVDTIDNVVTEKKITPNFIKLDVEGFELDVLKGMSGTLQSKELKFIAIEVHFALLENYGYKNAPKQICEILEKNNFKISWIDASHVICKRGK